MYDKGFIWYRAEVTKLFRHNIKVLSSIRRETSTNSRSYTLLEYLNLHIVYVSFKYRKNNPILEKLWEDDDNTFLDIILEKWASHASYQDAIDNPDMLPDFFKDFVERAKICEDHTVENRLIKEDIEKLLSDQHRVLESSLLAESIMAYLHKNGFTPILIFDGLDNIDYYEYADLYYDILSQIKDLCIRDDKSNVYFSRVIVSLRNETYEHLRIDNQYFFSHFDFIKH